MRRRSSCEGQVPGALLPVSHQIRDSVSHKSPRSRLRECQKSPSFESLGNVKRVPALSGELGYLSKIIFTFVWGAGSSMTPGLGI